MKNPAANDWRRILLAVGSGGAGLLLLTSGILGSVLALLGRWFDYPAGGTAALDNRSIVLGSLVVVGLLLLITTYVTLRGIRGHPNPRILLRPARVSEVVVILLAWLACSLLSQLVQGRDVLSGVTPLLQILAIGLPLLLLLRLALGSLPSGSVLRLWGALASGLLLATGIAAVIEMSLLIMVGSAAVLYLALNPERLIVVEELAVRLSQSTAAEDVLELLQPILTHPAALVGTLVAVSVVAPLVEELAKSAAPWLIVNRLDSPVAGFWCGAVSGAGFALFEGLIASADPSGQIGLILIVRGWSSLMHVLTSAVAGWGIASLRCGHGTGRLFMGYALAIVIHAAWNASVVLLGFGGIRSAPMAGGMDLPGTMALASGALGLVTLVLLMPVALVTFNRRLRTKQDIILGHNAGARGTSVTAGSVHG